MTARAFFLTNDGRVRAPWRILLFLAATVLCAFVVGSTLGPAIEWLLLGAGVRGATDTVVTVLALLAAHALMLRFVDRRPWDSVWLGGRAARPVAWGAGFAMGLAAIGIPVALLVAAGWMGWSPTPRGSWVGAALRTSIFLLPAALLEELFMRGYVMAAVREALGTWAAVLGTALVFALLHLRNPGASASSMVLVALAGVWLGVVVVSMRSLYAAWMAHFAWNWTMAVLFHTAVSGLWMETPDYRYVDAGPDWATGGQWGPEGGVPAGLGMVGGLTYLIARRKRREES